MIHVKSELQYRIIVELLDSLEEKGLLLPEERNMARQLAIEKYCPQTVWE